MVRAILVVVVVVPEYSTTVERVALPMAAAAVVHTSMLVVRLVLQQGVAVQVL